MQRWAPMKHQSFGMAQLERTRRRVLADAMAGIAAIGASSPLAAIAGSPVPQAGRALFGVAVRGDALDSDAAYAAAIISRCTLIVPEGALKWMDLRPDANTFEFGGADRIAAFAARHAIGLRGHTLAWYGAMPAWTEAITSRAEAERALTHHIETVVSRYRGLIGSWDVVNEPISENPGSPNDLRPFLWTRTLGSDYIPIALRAAASADPSARLVINEYDIEFVGPRFAARRAALLALVRTLLDEGVPLHAVGLQAHLVADRSIDRDGLQSFLREIRAFGLDVLVTELDVVDHTLSGAIGQRDAQVAEIARSFLSAVAEVSPPSAILTWGISDRYTWVPTYFSRGDGLANRPLPLDSDMRPKPLMSVLQQFTRTAS